MKYTGKHNEKHRRENIGILGKTMATPHRRDLQIKYPHKYKLEAKSQEQVQNCDKNIVVFRVLLSLQVIYNDSHMIGKKIQLRKEKLALCCCSVSAQPS